MCGYHAPEVTPAAGSLPANWPLITMGLVGSGFDWHATTLTRARDGHVVPLFYPSFGPDQGTVVLLEALTPGDAYALVHPICPVTMPRTTVYSAVAPIPGPASVGPFDVLGPFAANSLRGVANRFYFLVVSLVPDPGFDTTPWSSFRWQVSVDRHDGVSYPEFMTIHRTSVSIGCGTGPSSVPEGMHMFGVAAGPLIDVWTIRDSSTTSIDVRCASAVRVDADTLRPLTSDEIAYWDSVDMDAALAVTSDGASIDMDARTPDGGLDGGRMNMHTEPDTHSNCSASSARPHSTLPLIALATLSALGRWRRITGRAARDAASRRRTPAAVHAP